MKSLFLLLLLQTAPSFEVAVVKRNLTPNAPVRGGCRGVDSKFAPNDPAALVPLGRCVITGARLSHLMTIAYKTQAGRIQGGPGWLKGGGERWNVEAKAENAETATEEQLRTMLQTLLAEKFKLQLRRVMQDVSGFALVVDNDGPKFKAAGGEGEASYIVSTQVDGPSILAVVTAKRSPIAALATTLSGANLCLGAPGIVPVVDRTELTGVYDFTVTWERCRGDGSENVRATIPNALREQLGLKLEALKVPQEFLIVDQAEMPAEN